LLHQKKNKIHTKKYKASDPAAAAAADEKQVQAAKKKQPNKGGVYFPIAACQVRGQTAACTSHWQLRARYSLLKCTEAQLQVGAAV
jgi:hypothetical protein